MQGVRRRNFVVAFGTDGEAGFRTEVHHTEVLGELDTEVEAETVRAHFFVTDGQVHVNEGVHDGHELVANHQRNVVQTIGLRIFAIPMGENGVGELDTQFQVRDDRVAGTNEESEYVPLVLHLVGDADFSLALVVFEYREVVPGSEGSSSGQSGRESDFLEHLCSPCVSCCHSIR